MTDQTQSNEKGAKEASKAALAPAISLPKGGGAIRGIGEKFSVNPVTGTGALSIPLPLSPGRSGFTPQLSLAYDSGAGNGPFGFGWSISTPSITRKTDKGLPRYCDGDESDVYILSGAEDLVPNLDSTGQRTHSNRTLHGTNFEVWSYRPRIEGLFARIERWVAADTGLSHWRSITRDNVTSIYGCDTSSRVADPADPRKIFSYRIRRTWDDKGNVAVFDYLPEDSRGIRQAQANESNRNDAIRGVQRHLKAVCYGNVTPYFPTWTADGIEMPLPAEFLFKAVLDYGDHDPDVPTPVPDRAWPVRPDPFSIYRAAFEVRTYRRVQRVLMFHNFVTERTVGADTLVRSLDLLYSDQQTQSNPLNPIYTFLTSVTQTGYRRIGNSYTHRSLPPLEIEYSQPQIQPTVLTLDPASFENLPEGFDGTRFQWVDLDGEGLSGILTDSGGGWGYKRNLSPINRITQPDGSLVTRCRFGPLESVPALPSRSTLGGAQQLLDLSGGGCLDVVDFNAPTPGFFKRTNDANWEPFQRFESLPNINWAEPNLKFVDLTGDGLPDVLITEDGLYTLYPSLGEQGFGPTEQVRTPWDEERGPKIVMADGTETIFLADMSGDGLSDIVRVRNGEICYWPNLGYGNFGPKVTMDGAPRFTDEERFDPRRIRLADIDGSGTTDVLYIGAEGVLTCFNQSGNSWSKPTLIAVFPTVDSLSAVQVTDLLGTGTACLVWSSALPAEDSLPLRYVDLMGGQKPHLLVRMVNNLGAETRLAYAPSTRFYLADKCSGHPWVTKLPHVVQVVERMEAIDWIGLNRAVTRYAFHHGYFDGYEREFRGFGMVEQWDTEEYREDTQFPDGDALNWNRASWSPPMHTKTWFHTGAFEPAISVSQQYRSEYWAEPGSAATFLPDTILPQGLNGESGPPFLDPYEVREAYRSMKGQMLRSEVYAEDGSVSAEIPYTVTEQNFTIRWLQPMGENLHAVFFVHPREKVSFHYERDATDPRVTHDLTLEVDDFGNVLRSVSAGYPRRTGYNPPEPALFAAIQGMLAYDQTRLHVRATEQQYTNALSDLSTLPDAYRSPAPSATIVAELIGIAPKASVQGATNLFEFAELDAIWQAVWDGTHDLSYESVPTADVDGGGAVPIPPTRRIIGQSCTLYRSDDLTALLPPGQLERLALPGETYHAALTPGLLNSIFGALVPTATLNEGGYVQLPARTNWWAPTGRVFYSPGDADPSATELATARAHFFLTRRTIDPFGSINRVDYDGYDLLPAKATDPLGNVTAATYDYLALQPVLVNDPNGNQTAAVFDCLGLLTGTAVMGKTTENLGDSLTGFVADLDDTTIQAHFSQPLTSPNAILGSATTRIVYDLAAYYRTRDATQPSAPGVYTLARETHLSDLAASPGATTLYQHAFAYSDGFARVIQTKSQAKPGAVVEGGPVLTPRWIGSGWTIFNNKGNPVRKYEPFFTPTNTFEFAAQAGVSSILFYDPPARVVAALHPDNTWEKVVFDCWRQENWDGNDTVLISDPRNDPDVGNYFQRLVGSAAKAFVSWHDLRIGGNFGATADDQAAEQDAAQKASAHAGTPTVVHFDALGRTCLTVQDNAAAGRYPTRVALDTEGKPLAVLDAKERRVMEYVLRVPQGGGVRYVAGMDMVGNQLYQNGMDGSARRSLPDVQGKPIRRWDSRGHAFRIVYDQLRRPMQTFVIGSDPVNSDPRTIPATPGKEILYEWLQYGDGSDFPTATLNAAAMNVRTRIWRHWDCSGRTENGQFDFKGNLLNSTRSLISNYKGLPDWSITNPTPDSLLGVETFTTAITYDALNRPVTLTTPDKSVTKRSYSEANLLNTVAVNQRGIVDGTGQPVWTSFVTNIDHNAKAQRELINYQNGASTSYYYDPQTFRLTRLYTKRPAGLNGIASKLFQDATVVQDLNYAYDPVGNITRIRDDALFVLHYNGEQINPLSDYTYDAIYRLVQAEGREHIGQTAFAPEPQTGDLRDYPFMGLAVNPNDWQALRNYTEQYDYDEVGNFKTVAHVGIWTRKYNYTEPSLLEAGKVNNRLSSTQVGTGPLQPYSHDVHGNMVKMPHLPVMAWDFKDQLFATQQQIVTAGTGQKTYYLYDASGQRVVKVTESGNGTKVDARFYLGGYEIYREYDAAGTNTKLERDTLHVMDDKRRVALVETKTIDSSIVAPAGVLPSTLTRYQFDNHLGSASLELDDGAAAISYEEYYPYGTSSFQAARSQTEAAKRFRYTGKERDEETGLNYHAERYYAPWLGRWIAADPARIVDGLNVFLYGRSNPMKFVDPSGTQSENSELKLNTPTSQVGTTLENKTRAALSPGKLTLDQSSHGVNLKLTPEQLAQLIDTKAPGPKVPILPPWVVQPPAGAPLASPLGAGKAPSTGLPSLSLPDLKAGPVTLGTSGATLKISPLSVNVDLTGTVTAKVTRGPNEFSAKYSPTDQSASGNLKLGDFHIGGGVNAQGGPTFSAGWGPVSNIPSNDTITNDVNKGVAAGTQLVTQVPDIVEHPTQWVGPNADPAKKAALGTETGAVGSAVKDIGKIADLKPPKATPKFGLNATFNMDPTSQNNDLNKPRFSVSINATIIFP
jgi:RHS repeat-associated protein